MIIELRGKSVELTDAMREHFDNEITALEKYDRVISNSDRIHAEVHVYKMNEVKVQVYGQLKGDRRIEATKTGADYYKLVRQVVKDLEKQVRKMNERLKTQNSEEKGFKKEFRNEEIEVIEEAV